MCMYGCMYVCMWWGAKALVRSPYKRKSALSHPRVAEEPFVYATRLLVVDRVCRAYVMVSWFDDSERSKSVRETSMCKKEDEN
jgi:hypothetical protein